MSRRTLTFLMTDIQGSTRLWEDFPESMPLAVRRHEEIIDASISAAGGTLVKSKGEGDSTFSFFENATAAVRAAFAAQTEIRNESWPAGIEIRVRMGIHTGEVEAREGDFFGPTLSRCARIREVGHGGQIVLSGATRTLIASSPSMNLHDLGVHRLRDLQKPEHLFEVSVSKAKFPPLRSLTSLRNNLPPQLTSFIGRQSSIQDLRKLLGEQRLVTIVGTGGCGKTRLALQVGAEFLDGEEHGVWFIDMAPLRSKTELVASIAISLGITGNAEDGDAKSLIVSIGDMSNQVFIFDNAEHILPDVAEFVDQILRESPSTRMLVTSREPLRVYGEMVYRIPSLETPGEPPYDRNELAKIESVALFVERAVARLPRFELTDSNASSVATICRRMDGIPLAIEPVAAMVDMLTPQQIVSRMQDRFGLLATPDESANPRHRTIENAIDWSYGMLDVDQKLLLHRLTIFPATFAIDAVESGCASEPLSRVRVFNLVRSLADKSLIVCIHDEHETRYRLLEMVREFVVHREGEPAGDCLKLLTEWSVEVARLADGALSGPEQAFWLAKLENDLPTIRLTLEWAFTNDPESAIELTFLMRRYWLQKVQLHEGRASMERALALIPDSDALRKAKFWNTLGAFCSRLGQLDRAGEYYADVLAAAESMNDTFWTAAALNNLGLTAYSRTDYSKSISYFERAENLYRAMGDLQQAAVVLLNVGNCRVELEQFDEGIRCFEAAMEIAEQFEDFTRVAMLHVSIAHSYVRQQNHADAKAHLMSAFTIWRTIDDSPTMSAALLDLCEILIDEGRFADAAKLMGAREKVVRLSGVGDDEPADRQASSIRLRLKQGNSAQEFTRMLASGRALNVERIREFSLTFLH